MLDNLTTDPQNFTTSWDDLGGEIDTECIQALGIWLDIDINDTNDAEVRIVARHTAGGDNHTLPLDIITATVVNEEDEYIQFITDEDAKRFRSWTLDKIIPCVQVQIKCGTVGASAGQVLSSKYTIN